MQRPAHNWRRTGVVILVIVVMLAASAVSLGALATAGFQLSWWTVDGGGGQLEGGGYVLNATAGQPDAGLLTGPGYSLGGGFWTGGVLATPGRTVYLPVVGR